MYIMAGVSFKQSYFTASLFIYTSRSFRKICKECSKNKAYVERT
jgi:hypothetical protein